MRIFFEFIGYTTVAFLILVLLYCFVKIIIKNAHKHDYHVSGLWRTKEKSEEHEDWEIILKCEKCGKCKTFKFKNDKIKLAVITDEGDINEQMPV